MLGDSMSGKQPKRKERPGVDRMGRTPLHYAALEKNCDLVRELLASGLAADAADDNGWTPLHFAAQSNSDGAAALLLNGGASVDPRDSNGNTPLATAVFNSRGNGALIALLRSHGADCDATNSHAVSPLQLARTITNFNVRQFFEDFPDET
jgi:ankyrin repeat protein